MNLKGVKNERYNEMQSSLQADAFWTTLTVHREIPAREHRRKIMETGTTITDSSPKRGFRAAQAAQYLGISKSHFWHLAQQGRIAKGRRLGARLTLWFREDLDDFLNSLKSDATNN